jgi:hypothetical protein
LKCLANVDVLDLCSEEEEMQVEDHNPQFLLEHHRDKLDRTIDKELELKL